MTDMIGYNCNPAAFTTQPDTKLGTTNRSEMLWYKYLKQAKQTSQLGIK